MEQKSAFRFTVRRKIYEYVYVAAIKKIMGLRKMSENILCLIKVTSRYGGKTYLK
jgi:hypothetical protein